MTNKLNLEFVVTNQTIERKDRFFPVEKSENYLYVHFTFSDDWVGLKKRVTFKKDFSTISAYLEDDKAIVPSIINRFNGFLISVVGENDEGTIILTTNEYKVDVLKSGGTELYSNYIRSVESKTLLSEKNNETLFLEIPNIYGVKLKSVPDQGLIQLLGIDKEGEEVVLSSVINPSGSSYFADEETLTLEDRTFKISQSFLDKLYEDLENRDTIIYVDELPTSDIKNSLYCLNRIKEYNMYKGSVNITKDSNLPVVLISNEREIDTSRDYVAYIIETDTPYLVSGGSYSNLKSANTYNGIYNEASSFTDPDTYYLLRVFYESTYHLYSNGKWYQVIDDVTANNTYSTKEYVDNKVSQVIKPENIPYTLVSSNWLSLEDSEPFTVYNEIIVDKVYGENSVVEAVFSNKSLQAKYGIILNSLEINSDNGTQTKLRFYAATTPEEDISFEVIVYG